MVDVGEMRQSVILRGVRKLEDGPSSSNSPKRNRGTDEATGHGLPAENGRQPSSRKEDHYGFLYSMSEAELHYDPTLTPRKARERELKWLRMLDNWEYWMEHKPHKVKERCRKGIPPSLRGRAWMYLSGARKLLGNNRGLFTELTKKPDNEVVLNVIDKDLDRTFPSHVLFAKEGSQGQQDLRRVLKAYAMYNTKTGYCQAMAPVAATLLMHMTDEEAFWCLVQICEQYMPGYYSPGLHAFQIDAMILKHLLRKYLPNIKTFMDEKVPPSPDDSIRELDPMLYCTEWFMSMFSRSLPWPTVLRVWDMLFFEGVKVLYKVALAVLHLSFTSSQSKKECKGFFELTRKLRNLPIAITHESVLLPELLKYHLRRDELQQDFLSQADLHFTEERVRLMELEARRRKSNLSQSRLSVASETSDMSNLV